MSVDYGCVSLQPYVTSVALSDDVGMLVAGCIKDMVTAGVDKSKIHLMGLSLGAQICGKAGRLLDFQLSWILGLDPAGPLFENDITGTLNATDAQQVSCIHTDAGFLGTKYPCGGVEFYPNGGTRSQPGCSLTEMIAYANPQIGCSHIRAEFLQTEAVGNQNGFLAVKCDSYDYFKVDACNRSDIIPMGERPPALASGKYYLQTNGQRPYARGIDGTRYNATIDSSTVI
ncbi:PREDICTED: lipase member H-B-like [Dufourea novaeangliae]|uniref:lipase member H-B-like n=1 Tax=Dufourea novaeangliae TaxID=178035 RepID=UPI00076798B7|nr:PREDICTED: lipase member H-B-like [Dufourea novaeangliae]